MSMYGKVIKITPKYHPGEPKIQNGTFTVVMETRKRLPNFIEIFGKKIQLYYPGLREQCRKCKKLDHKARECNIKACHKCGVTTHLIKDCPNCPQCLKEHKGGCKKPTFAEILQRGFPKPKKNTEKRKENEQGKTEGKETEKLTDTKIETQKKQDEISEHEKQENETKESENETKNTEKKKQLEKEEKQVDRMKKREEKKRERKTKKRRKDTQGKGGGNEVDRISRKRTRNMQKRENGKKRTRKNKQKARRWIKA
ncbi:uncharacterized protein [Centruroides vittatus]|uniref:uncharacterized protein n=1 Tax=Centruroides vittatus TaxID=120091 RepID=UPI00350F82F6